MRFAAIADVHGNYLALEAVLADIRAQGVSDTVNLGDMASGPLDARRTMDVLMAVDAVHVLGNHDRWLIDRPVEKMGAWERPAYPQLDAAHFDWLRTVPATRVITLTTEDGCRDRQYSPLSRFWELEAGSNCGTLGFRGYRPLSVAIGVAARDPQTPTSPAPDHTCFDADLLLAPDH